MTRFRITLGLSIALAAVAAVAWAQQSDDVLLIAQPMDRDVYAAHRQVLVQANIDGDLVAAGKTITVEGDVTGDVLAAGQNITIRSNVRDDVRAAGQHIRIEGPVSGHIVAAGQTVTINQPVGDWASLRGNTVVVVGNVGSNLEVQARTITIDAEVTGNVQLSGEEFSLGPNAVVGGDLTWRSDNEANISSEARIDGRLIEERPPGFVDELSSAETYSLPLNTIIAVTVLFLLFAPALRASATRVATKPGWALLLGLGVFGGMPLLAILLFVTGIGTWLGFLVLLIYIVLLMLGVLTGLFAASDWLLRKFNDNPVRWQSVAAIFVTVVAVGLIASVPRVGFGLVVLILLVGVGALCWNAWMALRSLEGGKAEQS